MQIRRIVFLGALVCAPINVQAVDLALLSFCVAKPPDGSKDLAEWHSNYCPQVLSDAVRANQLALDAAERTAAGTAITQQGTVLTQEQAAVTAQLVAEKAQLENFKASLPSGITVTKPDAVDVSAFSHLAKYRQVALLKEAAESIGTTLAGGSFLHTGTLMVNKAQLDELTRNTVDPQVVIVDLNTLQQSVETWLVPCPPETDKTAEKIKKLYGFESSNSTLALSSIDPTTAIPLALESLVGSVGRIAAMFQTNMVGASTADLTGEQGEVLQAAFLSRAISSKSKLYSTLPPVRSTNSVLVALDELRQSTLTMSQSMGKYDEKTACAKEGKTLLDAIARRVEMLNTPTATGPSPITSALRRATLTEAGPLGDEKIEQYLLLNVDYTSGSVAAVKRGIRSAYYVQSAAVVVSYRLQHIDGSVVAAGVDIGTLDRQQYDKNLSLRTQPADQP